jgi:hypothetical protein
VDRLLGAVIIVLMVGTIAVSWWHRMRAPRRKHRQEDRLALLAFIMTLAPTYCLLRLVDAAPWLPFVGGSVAGIAAALVARQWRRHMQE